MCFEILVMFFRKWIKDTSKYSNALVINELNKNILKSLLSSADISLHFRFYFFRLLQNYSKFSSISFYRKFCIISGYSKSVFRLFRLSRHKCKQFASDGVLVGMRKSSF